MITTDVQQLIRARKAVFPDNFEEKEISKALLLEVLENAIYAPTHRITEPWRFVVFQGESKEKLASFLQSDYQLHNTADEFNEHKYEKRRKKVEKSGAIIAICMQESGMVPEWEEIAATSMAVQNIWLSLDSYGLGGYWSSPASALENMDELIDLRENEVCIGLFYIGYAKKHERKRKRTPIDEKTTWA